MKINVNYNSFTSIEEKRKKYFCVFTMLPEDKFDHFFQNTINNFPKVVLFAEKRKKLRNSNALFSGIDVKYTVVCDC